MSDVLTVDAVPAYVAGRAALREGIDASTLDVREVGDGNLNQVFVCRDGAGRSVVLKQALPYVRLVGPEWPMTEDRARREARAIRAHARLSEHVVGLIEFDAERHVLAMEDLSDHEVLRSRLNRGGTVAGIAEALARYVADVAFGTSWFGLGAEAFRQEAAASINSELCALTEDVIFTEPFLGAERNSYPAALAPLVDELQADRTWVAAAAALKIRMLTVQEAFVHGDLHSGSVFVRGEGAQLSVKTFDSEFAWYGPIGFDLGLMWANLLTAAARAQVLGEPERSADLLDGIARSWRVFVDRMSQLWPTRVDAPKYPDLALSPWLDSIRSDGLGFAGCEATRRIIGLAKVTDIETLDPPRHLTASTAVLRGAQHLLVHRAEPVDAAVAALSEVVVRSSVRT
jgi:5-methylthioribose kinase